MNIGISCYPTYGGSGVVATELAIALAKRGHQVHIISYALPMRLDTFMENIFFTKLKLPLIQFWNFLFTQLLLQVKLLKLQNLQSWI